MVGSYGRSIVANRRYNPLSKWVATVNPLGHTPVAHVPWSSYIGLLGYDPPTIGILIMGMLVPIYGGMTTPYTGFSKIVAPQNFVVDHHFLKWP